MKKRYKRGDKKGSLIFWGYTKNAPNGETWLTKEKFESYKNTRKKWRLNHLKWITESALNRDRKKYKTCKKSLITYEFVKELWVKQKGICYWLNIPMTMETTKKHTILSNCSIERLDNSKGYSKSNVVLCTQFANMGRGSATIKEF